MVKKTICLVALSLIIFSFAVSADSSMEVSSLLLKVSLKQDETLTKSITISNSEGMDYNLEVISVPGVELSEQNFILKDGEQKIVDVKFDSMGVTPGIYVGSIDISSLKETLALPVILEVESKDIFFDANLDIPPAYTEIAPGEKVVAQIKVFDLTSGGTTDGVGALGTVSIDLEYSVSDLKGRVLSSESERMVIDKQTQVTKTFSFPEKIEEGDYVMSVLVRYGSSVGMSSQMFSIKGAVMESPSLGIFNSSSTFVFVLILAFTLGIVFLFVYIIRDRDKFIADLRRYHSQELKTQREILMDQARFLRKQGVGEAVIKKEVSEKVKVLKKEQNARVKELRVLKSKGNVNEMKKKVKEWEKKGYTTNALKYKLNDLSVKDMTKLMSKWKSKGYK